MVIPVVLVVVDLNWANAVGITIVASSKLLIVKEIILSMLSMRGDFPLN